MTEQLYYGVEEVVQALDLMLATTHNTEPPIGALVTLSNQAHEHIIRHGNSGSFAWMNWYSTMGGVALAFLKQEFPEVTHLDLAKILMEKHKRYGISPLLRWLQMGVVAKVDLKVHRIINIVGNGRKEEDKQDLQDNISDIANYCALGRALRSQYQ